MNTYTIEIHTYPQEFIITANTESEALEKAKERFYAVTTGQSIYESKIIEVN